MSIGSLVVSMSSSVPGGLGMGSSAPILKYGHRCLAPLFDDLETERVDFDGIEVTVVTPEMLYTNLSRFRLTLRYCTLKP